VLQERRPRRELFAFIAIYEKSSRRDAAPRPGSPSVRVIKNAPQRVQMAGSGL
jgi:hypothetical protein